MKTAAILRSRTVQVSAATSMILAGLMLFLQWNASHESRDDGQSRWSAGNSTTPTSPSTPVPPEHPSPPVRCSVSGIVVHADGSRAGMSRVTLVPEGASEYANPGPRSVQTDESATFSFEDLPPCRFRITAAQDRISAQEDARIDLTRGMSLRDVVIVLREFYEASVQVLGQDGSPIPGIEVTIDDHRSLFTDVSGSVHFSVDSLDRPVIEVPEPETQNRKCLRSRVAKISRSSPRAILVLEDAGSVTGSVKSDSGEVLPDLEVTAYRDGELVSRTRTDPGGTFSALVPLSGAVELRVDLMDGFPIVPTLDGTTRFLGPGRVGDVRNGQAGIEMRLQEISCGLELKLRIEDPAGQGVPGARVHLKANTPESRLDFNEATSDADGRVTFPDLPDVPHRVDVVPADSRTLADCLPERRLNLRPGEVEIVVRLRQGRRVQGLVLLPDGQAAGHASVRLTGAWFPKSGLNADDAGLFEFLIDPAQPSHLRVEAEKRVNGRYLSGSAVVGEGSSVTVWLLREE